MKGEDEANDKKDVGMRPPCRKHIWGENVQLVTLYHLQASKF